MGQIQERIEKIRKLVSEIKNHHMCADFEQSETHFLVIYPPGFFPDGTRVEIGDNIGKALERLLKAMNQHWDDSIL